jgi:hypothetical protein
MPGNRLREPARLRRKCAEPGGDGSYVADWNCAAVSCDPPRNWTGSEYVGIYATIEKSNVGNPGVHKPGQNQGISLKQWLEA